MSKSLELLYNTYAGRYALKVLTSRPVSKIAGSFLDSYLSVGLIGPFVRNNRINLKECEKRTYRSFNEFFTRRLKKDARSIDRRDSSFISPCDGLLSIWPIDKDTVLPIKQSKYRVSDLFEDKKLASEFENGLCFVFRLCVNHYHRYIYIDDGFKSVNHFIAGKLHTVRPIALRHVPVFTENCREYTIMNTKNFGRVAQIEVGAMLVGKIDNYDQKAEIKRGKEKGKFLYGGSTIILLVKPDKLKIESSILRKTMNGSEFEVKMGQKIASAM